MARSLSAMAGAALCFGAAGSASAATEVVTLALDAATFDPNGFEYILPLDVPIDLGIGDTLDISVTFSGPVQFGYRDKTLFSGVMNGPTWPSDGDYAQLSWEYEFSGATGVFPASGGGQHSNNTYMLSNVVGNFFQKPVGLGSATGFRQQITIEGVYTGFEFCPSGICWTGPVTTPTRFTHLRFWGADSSVPEPATWALLILGLGLAGVALRASRASTEAS